MIAWSWKKMSVIKDLMTIVNKSLDAVGKLNQLNILGASVMHLMQEGKDWTKEVIFL